MAREAKYRQVESFIKDGIRDGSLEVGSRIMTEEQLCEHFGYSRMTINKALNSLASEGYIKRVPGKGSFVASVHVSKPSDSLKSFTEDMRDIGMVAGSKLLSSAVVRAETVPEVQAKLSLGDDDLVHEFSRLRTGDGKPVAISYNYVSASVIPAIDVACLSRSFYAFLDSLGIEREYCGSEFRAVLPTDEQKRLLEADDIALLCSAHCTYTRIDGLMVPFEYTETYYNGNIYTYVTRD